MLQRRTSSLPLRQPPTGVRLTHGGCGCRHPTKAEKDEGAEEEEHCCSFSFSNDRPPLSRFFLTPPLCAQAMSSDQPCYTLINTGAGEFDLPSEQELKKELGTKPETGDGAERNSCSFFLSLLFFLFFLPSLSCARTLHTAPPQHCGGVCAPSWCSLAAALAAALPACGRVS